MSVLKHFYIEKRKTLQLYHCEHQGEYPLLPNATGRSYLGEFSNFKDMLEFAEDSKMSVMLKGGEKINSKI